SEHMMRGDEVIVFAMSEGANQGELVISRGKPRQMFAKDDARDLGRNRFEFAPDLWRRVWFQIKGIQVAWRTGEEDDEHGFGRAGGVRSAARAEPRRQTEPEQAGKADLKNFAAVDADAMPMAGRTRGHRISFQAGGGHR